jgi:hypothetical protein
MGNSFLGKMFTYSPMTHLGVSKYVDPVANHFFGGYSSSSGPGTPGPYAGRTPTLADANRGYTGTPSGPLGAAAGSQAAPNAVANPYAAVSQNIAQKYGSGNPPARVPTPGVPGAMYG